MESISPCSSSPKSSAWSELRSLASEAMAEETTDSQVPHDYYDGYETPKAKPPEDLGREQLQKLLRCVQEKSKMPLA